MNPGSGYDADDESGPIKQAKRRPPEQRAGQPLRQEDIGSRRPNVVVNDPDDETSPGEQIGEAVAEAAKMFLWDLPKSAATDPVKLLVRKAKATARSLGDAFKSKHHDTEGTAKKVSRPAAHTAAMMVQGYAQYGQMRGGSIPGMVGTTHVVHQGAQLFAPMYQAGDTDERRRISEREETGEPWEADERPAVPELFWDLAKGDHHYYVGSRSEIVEYLTGQSDNAFATTQPSGGKTFSIWVAPAIQIPDEDQIPWMVNPVQAITHHFARRLIALAAGTGVHMGAEHLLHEEGNVLPEAMKAGGELLEPLLAEPEKAKATLDNWLQTQGSYRVEFHMGPPTVKDELIKTWQTSGGSMAVRVLDAEKDFWVFRVKVGDIVDEVDKLIGELQAALSATLLAAADLDEKGKEE